MESGVLHTLIRRDGGTPLLLHGVFRGFDLAVAEIVAVLDRLGDFRGDHRFPGRVVILDSAQDVAGKNMQDGFIEIVELLDPAAFDEVAVQALQCAGHF